MTRRVALLVLITTAAGCGYAPTSPPPPSTFALTTGAYRLSFAGTSCFIGTGGTPSTPGSSTIDLPVTLVESGGSFALAYAGHPISGALMTTGSILTGTLAGSAVVGAIAFRTGPVDGAPIVFGGVAQEGERYEGQMTSGQVDFTVADAGGSVTAFCLGAAFTLRRA